MAVLTTGSVTITVSGEQRVGKQRRRICKVSCTSGTLTTGKKIALPASANSYGLKTRLDYLELIGGQDETVDVVMKYDYANKNGFTVYLDKAQTSSGALTNSALASLATTSNVSGQTFYVAAWGY